MKASEVVAALFDNQADAEQAIRDLREAGFSPMDIGIILRDPLFARAAVLAPDSTPVPGETALAGALDASILGGVVGPLVEVGAFALPRLGSVIAGGAVVRALIEAEPGPAAGDLLGALVRLGIADAAAGYFEDGVRERAVLVTIDPGARAEAAGEILHFARGDLAAGLRLAEDVDASETVEDGAWSWWERRDREDSAYEGPERRASHR
jgi:hypothetical protein